MAQQVKLIEHLSKLCEREDGQDMLEYALLATLISVVAITIVIALGPYIKNLFQDVVNALGVA
ncbi:MAG: hypothetical protein NVS2B16_18890 [Chloroflexota bacterium]